MARVHHQRTQVGNPSLAATDGFLVERWCREVPECAPQVTQPEPLQLCHCQARIVHGPAPFLNGDRRFFSFERSHAPFDSVVPRCVCVLQVTDELT